MLCCLYIHDIPTLQFGMAGCPCYAARDIHCNSKLYNSAWSSVRCPCYAAYALYTHVILTVHYLMVLRLLAMSILPVTYVLLVVAHL
jgi:hypothetical protein